MILAVVLPPTPAQVVIGILTAMAAALIATTSFFMARRSHNWPCVLVQAHNSMRVCSQRFK